MEKGKRKDSPEAFLRSDLRDSGSEQIYERPWRKVSYENETEAETEKTISAVSICTRMLSRSRFLSGERASRVLGIGHANKPESSPFHMPQMRESYSTFVISQPFNRFKKRDKPRRKRPELFGHSHGERLRGSAKTARRRELFERSKGRCEAIKPVSDEVMREFGLGGVTNWFAPCRKRITWETMEWSHKRHAANKCDCMECGIASCRECHQKSHNAGGKPCPKKVSEPGQVSGGL